MSDDTDNGGESEVGYKKPPKHTRFKKGRSGNPKGRAKGKRNIKTDLAEELSGTIRLTEGGAQRQVTRQRALVKAMLARAIQGDVKFASFILNLAAELHEANAETPQETYELSKEDDAILDGFFGRNPPKKESEP